MTDANASWPIPSPDSLGPMYGADDVRDAVRHTIDTWSPYYLRMLSGRLSEAGKIGGRPHGVKQPPNPLPNFGKWRNTPDYRNLTAGEPATFLVTVSATVGKPTRQGTGLYIATWRATVAVVVFGTSWQESVDLTSWYEKAVRWSILQHTGLGGLAKNTTWAGARYDIVEHTDTRTLSSSIMGFDVMVPNVINGNAGPTGTEPPGNFTVTQDPTADEVVVNLTKAPITEDS